MILVLRIILLLITVVAFMGLIAEPGKDQKLIYAAVTIAGIVGSLSAFIML